MRLYIWHNVLTDYTDGVIVALAENIIQARKLVLERGEDWEREDLVRAMRNDYEVHSKPHAFSLWGGG